MINIILTGASGAMGKNIIESLESHDNMKISAAIDKNPVHNANFPIYPDFSSPEIYGDVIIDFSHHSLVPSLLDFIEKTGTPAVICTTGISEQDMARIRTLSESTPIFKSGNMSLGINLLIDLVKKASNILGTEGFDIEIVEKHHNRKVDAPSGTAYMIADAINEEFDNSMKYQYGRSGTDCKRKPEEIGIHALRGGTIVGEHTVYFAGLDEIIEIKHTASSRKVFAKGAIKAAEFLVKQHPGLYDMKTMFERS